MITLLDGGMGQELVKRAGKATSLWSIQALIDDPDMVRAVHDDYFAAGADVATTYSYSVLPDRLETHGIADKRRTINRRQNHTAATDFNASLRIAGVLDV